MHLPSLLTRLGRTLLLAAAASPLGGCVGYVLSSGYYQADLLRSREPAEEVLASGTLSVGEEQRLRLVPALKAYGQGLGLSATDNYDTLAVGWDHTIWNFSACAPLSFESVTWRFPIVGKVPYLGFFEREDADRRAEKYRKKGYDVYVRSAGAYSTLGWFRDPVLPGMLRWSEADLAETVFHELAHATLWVPGSVSFNESFANFVGEVAAERYLADRYGPRAEELRENRIANEDYRRWQVLLHGLYKDLDAMYKTPGLDDATRLQNKIALYGSMKARIEASDIVKKGRFVRAATSEEWNNARLMQHRTYNTSRDDFKALYAKSNDIPTFISDLRAVVAKSDEPFVALKKAAGRADVQNP